MKSASSRLKDQIDRLRDSANEASQLARKVYLSFLLFSVYIAILVGSTTDEQLLRGTGAKLPILNVELPIVGTYLVVPLIFLFFHLNLLILLYLLSQKLYTFSEHIEKLPQKQQEVEQRLLYPFPFSQMLVGKHQARLDQFLLAIMVKSTLIVFPIALLLWAQVRFLPYHNTLITWIHRATVLGDLLLLLLLWPKIRAPNGHWLNWLAGTSDHRPVWKRKMSVISRICLLGTLGLVVVILSVSIVMIPDEWIEEKVGWEGLTSILFDKRKTPFHRNLILRELTLVRQAPPPELLATYDRMEKETDLAWVKYAKGLDLRERDLRFAEFYRANLTKIDLRVAKLEGANLWYANLQGADLTAANLPGADLGLANLEGADLGGANLEGADLGSANLQGASLRVANLQGASLEEAELQGANLVDAELQGARLREANLQGVDLRGSKIGGTHFRKASLDLSDLRYVNCTPLTPDDWQKLKEELKETVPEGERRTHALERLEEAEKRVKTTFPSIENAKNVLSDDPLICGELPVQNINESDYDRKLTQFLFDLACRNKYLAQGIARRVEVGFAIDRVRTIWPALAKKLLDSDCKAVQELPKDVLEKLEKIAEKAQKDKNQ